MKKLLMIITLLTAGHTYAMDLECHEVAFEGDKEGIAARFPAKIFIEKLSSDDIMISLAQGENGIIAEKKFTNSYRDFIGYSNYRINYFGEKVRVGTLFLGYNSKKGEAFYSASSGCRGGYNSGCSSVGRKTYSCRAL